MQCTNQGNGRGNGRNDQHITLQSHELEVTLDELGEFACSSRGADPDSQKLLLRKFLITGLNQQG
jgi:hypothetical protein